VESNTPKTEFVPKGDDYTEWRQTAFDGESLNDLYSKSADAWFAKEADKNPGAL